MTPDELRQAIAEAADRVNAIGDSRRDLYTLDDLDALIVAWAELSGLVANATIIRDTLADTIARLMPDKRHTAPGITVERHRSPKRTAWNTADLVRAVLDTRLVDETTGEVTEETPVDKVRAVWNLGAPRVTALRARGLEPDEFCTTEQRDAWTLRPYTNKGGTP